MIFRIGSSLKNWAALAQTQVTLDNATISLVVEDAIIVDDVEDDEKYLCA
jgi:hypothetical protein